MDDSLGSLKMMIVHKAVCDIVRAHGTPWSHLQGASIGHKEWLAAKTIRFPPAHTSSSKVQQITVLNQLQTHS